MHETTHNPLMRLVEVRTITHEGQDWQCEPGSCSFVRLCIYRAWMRIKTCWYADGRMLSSRPLSTAYRVLKRPAVSCYQLNLLPMLNAKDQLASLVFTSVTSTVWTQSPAAAVSVSSIAFPAWNNTTTAGGPDPNPHCCHVTVKSGQEVWQNSASWRNLENSLNFMSSPVTRSHDASLWGRVGLLGNKIIWLWGFCRGILESLSTLGD